MAVQGQLIQTQSQDNAWCNDESESMRSVEGCSSPLAEMSLGSEVSVAGLRREIGTDNFVSPCLSSFSPISASPSPANSPMPPMQVQLQMGSPPLMIATPSLLMNSPSMSPSMGLFQRRQPRKQPFPTRSPSWLGESDAMKPMTLLLSAAHAIDSQDIAIPSVSIFTPDYSNIKKRSIVLVNGHTKQANGGNDAELAWDDDDDENINHHQRNGYQINQSNSHSPHSHASHTSPHTPHTHSQPQQHASLGFVNVLFNRMTANNQSRSNNISFTHEPSLASPSPSSSSSSSVVRHRGRPRGAGSHSRANKAVHIPKNSRNSGQANYHADGQRKVCGSCGTKTTPYWRDGWDGICLCNACGIRYKKRKVACSSCWYVPRKDERAERVCPRCKHGLFQ